MVNRLYVDEHNVKLETTLLDADISGYSGLIYTIKKPSETKVTFPLTVEQDGSDEDEDDAIVFYLTEVGDLDEVGIYFCQVELTFLNSNYLSDTVRFQVHDRYEF
jgi:hypothetical protein